VTLDCKKCLLRESQDEELYQTIAKYVSNLPLSEKASPETYEARLDVCKNCDCLINGMCKLCGCFVEVRTAKAKQRCAKDLW